MLEIKNLTKKFDNKVVLNGINLNVNKGDVIGIIGPSGCGKSTLLRDLMVLVSLLYQELLWVIITIRLLVEK